MDSCKTLGQWLLLGMLSVAMNSAAQAADFTFSNPQGKAGVDFRVVLRMITLVPMGRDR